jgi:hypothetical protein
VNFAQWELFIRERELATYVQEKDQREAIYKMLKKELTELKKSNPIDFQKQMKEKLFGNKLSLYKISCDYLIPPQHSFNLYFKAARSESDLDEFYNKTNSYLKYLIKNSKNQLQLLNNIISTPKLIKRYEKLNISKYYENFAKHLEEFKKDYNSEEKVNQRKEANEILKAYSLKKAILNHLNESSAHFTELLFEKSLEKGYDMSTGLTDEQMKDLYETMRNENRKRRLNSDDILNEIKYPIDPAQYLTKSELYNSDALKEFITKEDIEELQKFEKSAQEKKEDSIRDKNYHEAVRRFRDRQVKKRYKPDVSGFKSLENLI